MQWVARALVLSAIAGAAAAWPASAAATPLGSAGLAHPPASVLPRGLVTSGAPAGPDYPGALWEPASRANYTVADRPLTNPVTRLVIHVAEGGWASTYTWFRNPAAQASANYVVSATGRVAQMVSDRDIAWHAGNWAYNETSIGIEHAGYTNRTVFPDAQYRGSARLAAWLADRYLITPDRRHVIGHNEVPDPFHKGLWGGADHHTDPGRTWDWARYMAYLRLDAADTYQATADDAQSGHIRYDPAVWRRASAEPGAWGGGYLAARAPATPVTFRLVVPRTDAYDVFARWPCGANSARVPVTVGAAAGPRTVVADEAAGCDRWVRLGAWTLTAGTGLVRVGPSARTATTVADAVRIVEQRDPVPPSTPALAATAAETSLSVTWPAATDNIAVGGYRVRLDGRTVQVGTQRAYAAGGLACGTVHAVSVRAVDLVSNVSARAQAWVRTSACPPPPTDLQATPSIDSVDLVWTAPAAAGLTYRVYTNGHLAGTTSSTTYTVTGLTCATTRTFEVRSVDASGSVSTVASVVATTSAC